MKTVLLSFQLFLTATRVTADDFTVQTIADIPIFNFIKVKRQDAEHELNW